MSTLSEKSFCTSEDKDAQERSSETKTNVKEEAQKNERRNLPYDLAKKIYPSDFRTWPILSLLKPEFTTQIRMVMVYGDWGNKALIVTKDKNVYTLDYNKDDYLKIDDTHIGLYPKKIEELCGKNIKTFACSLDFILALTQEGEVYFWELKKNESNDGSNTPVITSTPTPVAGLRGKFIVDIACGSHHSLVLTRDGKVYAWGDNKYGQIGNGTRIYGDNRPRQVRYELEGKKVVHIACGLTFNMVVTDEGKLYGWGSNYGGEISIHTTSNESLSDSGVATSDNVQSHYVYPRKITALSGKAIVKVACGYNHTLALTDEGKLYAWGMNDEGQLGVNNEQKYSAPVMVDMPELVLDIAAYSGLSVAVGYSKTIYVWGYCFDEVITTPFPTTFSRIHDAFAFSGTNDMRNPLIVSTNNDVEEVLTLLECLRRLFDDPSTSDFIVQVEGQSIYVHKAILKIRCQHFKNKFQHDWTDCKNDQSIPDPPAVYTVSDKFSYIVYKAFLKYLYTGTVDLPSEQVLELMKLADEYCETNLKRECVHILKQAITSSNVAFFYGKAIGSNAKEIEEFCFQFALCHMKDVVLSEEYIKLDTTIKDNFMRRAALKNVFKTFLERIWT